MPKLSPQDLEAAKLAFPHWTVDEDGMARDLTFADFPTAFAFMTAVAAEADRADHHPDWSNVYDKVSILLTTHEADGLTAKDTALAKAVDEAAYRFNGKS